MDKKLVLIFFLISKVVFAQQDSGHSSADIDFNKVNGSRELDKLSFTNIETSMKLMEDNILKLMRELGELKMQVHELKNNVKKEVEAQQKFTEQQKNEIEAGMDLDVTGTDKQLNADGFEETSVTGTKAN